MTYGLFMSEMTRLSSLPPGTTRLESRDPGLDEGVEVRLSVRIAPGIWWPRHARHVAREPGALFIDEMGVDRACMAPRAPFYLTWTGTDAS